MYKLKYSLCLLLLLGIGGCKLNKDIPQDKPTMVLAPKYHPLADTNQVSLPSIKTFLGDSTLMSLIDTALKNNFDRLLSLQKIEIAKAGVRFTKGLGLPELSAVAGLGGRKFGNYTIDGVGNYDTKFSSNLNDKQQLPSPFVPDFQLGLQSSWEADIWGKLKSQKKAAVARFLASNYGKNIVETYLIAEIADAYYELLVLDNELVFLEENIKLQESSLEMVRILKQAGEANQLGVELLKGQLLSSMAFKIEVNQQILETESRINFLLGRYPQPIKRPVFAWEKVIPPRLVTGVPSALLESRPDIKQAEMEIVATNADLASAKKAFYPSLNITGTLGLQSFNALLLLDPASAAYSLGAGLVAPLANRRQLYANLMSAEAEQKTAYLNYQKAVVGAFTEVYNYLNLINTTGETYKLKDEEVTTLKNSISISAELFRSGRATYLEVITAQKNALQAQIELISIKRKQYNAVIGLYRSLGGGWR